MRLLPKRLPPGDPERAQADAGAGWRGQSGLKLPTILQNLWWWTLTACRGLSKVLKELRRAGCAWRVICLVAGKSARERGRAFL